eukprot:TRINITY_DN7256_c0_g1_i6.p1 TRINITY_DN7256_c0_g1~~TRINITY_DN7256_c0_g1_i6.p1  ORF type:complete len:298 (+),score=48.42 TRINITY_DN7256_c0_g1_i6:28-894(+)
MAVKYTTGHSLQHVLRVADLPFFFPSSCNLLNLVDPLLPETWTYTTDQGNLKPFKTICENIPSENWFIDIGHNGRGERFYVSLNEAHEKESGPLTQYSEQELQKLKIEHRTVMARYHYKDSNSHFTIVSELSVGTHKLLLSNALVLLSNIHRSFSELQNVSLIVNCQSVSNRHTYSVKTEKILAHPIHDIGQNIESDIEVFMKINVQIWESLQKGNVVVHCLAGFHRAACVVVSHFLWRYHVLGHHFLSNDLNQIYSDLSERRRGVSPLDYIDFLKIFRSHLEGNPFC